MSDTTIALHRDRVPITNAMLSVLRRHYPALQHRWSDDGRCVWLDMAELDPKKYQMLCLDLEFYGQNPQLPLENLCAHLENYQPKNSSQEELLHFAQRLIDFNDDSMGAGLYMYGEAGIGKSHIAIAVSKQFMQRGLDPNFMVADRYTLGSELNLQPGQVWVIDDMNSGFHLSSRMFKQVVLNAHDRGGRVFVTSNKNYEELMSEMFVGDSKANRIRYEDRTKGMFKILHVTGESYRQANAWYR